MERFAFNDSVRDAFGFSKADIEDPELRELAFFSIFPNQIDVGSRKSDTWSWMCSRIRDGNNVRTPRDLHALVQNSARKQLEFLSIASQSEDKELIGAAAIKAGLSQLSTDKVYTTLVAENPDLEKPILAFKKQKAEQNDKTLEQLLGGDWINITERLVRIGLLEKMASSWKVPIMYRDGLEITQGAAFDKAASSNDT